MYKSKILWDDDYLRSFVDRLLKIEYANQFWEFGEDDEVLEYKDSHYRTMVEKFLPSLGIWNLNLGDSEEGTSIRQLIFMRDGRCQNINSKTLRTILNKVWIYMGELGDQLRNRMIKTGRSNPLYTESFLENIPELYDKTPYLDKSTSVCRFFQNGWVEITKEGVSSLRPYKDLPDDVIIWNSNVIQRDYVTTETFEVLEKQLLKISSDSINPITGERIDDEQERKRLFRQWKNKMESVPSVTPNTHFRDYVENLSRNDDGEIDSTSLERIKLSIGYLCHRYHVQSKRRCVVYVDKFYPGRSRDVSDGGTGKSLIPKCLGELMNRTEVNGKKMEKGKNDLFPFGNVKMTTELVHIDDVTSKFDFEKFFNHVTGDFEIRKMGRVDVIPSHRSPKMVICSNHPIQGEGNSFSRRQFIVEIGNYYKVMDEEYDGLTPYEIHGYKHLGSDEWSETDWSEFYKFVFECISLYLKQGGLPRGGESRDYKRQKLEVLIGSSDLIDFFVRKFEEYSEHGEEVFVEVLYKEVRSLFPDHTKDVLNGTIWSWFKEVGKMMRMGCNFHLKVKGSLDKQRLTEDRWNRWVVEGMEHHQDKDGKSPQKGDRVQVFKVSSFQKPETLFTKPEFHHQEGEVTK